MAVKNKPSADNPILDFSYKDKAEKKWTVENRSLPAANASGKFGHWAFVEVSQDIRTFRNQLDEALKRIAAAMSAGWAA